MKKVILAVAVFATSVAAHAQTKWSVDATHSSVHFTVTHLAISETEGNFKKVDGSITTAKGAKEFENAQIEFTVDVNSINTESEMRDGHLKGEDFFAVAKYPTMTFKSTSFKKGKGKQYLLSGDLTAHGVTKKVNIPVIYGGTVKDFYGNTKAGFKAQLKFDRNAYGITGGKAGGTIGNEVTVDLKMEFQAAK
jgi:polyisoprenoid-binding protein YceI